MSIYIDKDIIVFQNETAEIATPRLIDILAIDPPLPWHMIASGTVGAEAFLVWHTFDDGVTWTNCKSEDENITLDKKNNFRVCYFKTVMGITKTATASPATLHMHLKVRPENLIHLPSFY